MFEISYNDKELFDEYVERGKAYKKGKYDFTFEGRFIIYHAKMKNMAIYIAIDMQTGLASKIVETPKDNLYTELTYKRLIPKILYSIKYTGDRRYINKMNVAPNELIDLIFRVILPNNGYSIREEQIELSKTMYKGFTSKQISICEAEVGTGKTMAYLVAAFVAKYTHEKEIGSVNPITITTSSIELQNALVEKEIPNLSKMLLEYCIISKPFNVVLRKGKEHYFCRKRMIDFQESLKRNKEEHSELIEKLEKLAKRTYVLDLDKYNLNSTVKSRICVNGTCEECQHKSGCCYKYFMGYAYAGNDIDFQVVNHNLYLMAQKNKTEGIRLLNESAFVLVDEAHKFKEAAVDVYGEKFTKQEIEEFLNRARFICKEKEYEILMKDLRNKNEKLFSKLYQRINASDFEDEKRSEIKLSSSDIKQLKKIVNNIEQINDFLSPIHKVIRNKGKEIIRKISVFVRSSEHFISLEMDENNIFFLTSHPKNIDVILNKDVWNKDVSHVLTSGTMSDGENFEYFKKENGLNRIPAHLILESKTESPFDYLHHSRLYIPNDMPKPNNEDEIYIETIAEKINALIKATNGHTAILFTSYKVLRAVYDILKDKLNKYDVFCMTRGDRKSIAQFKNSKNGVLFASGAMWEGVDCAGDCLSSVIIVRLPFPMRSVLLEEKKKEEADTAEFIKEYCVPNMLIKLRQGAGRLIRTEKDTGVLSILDSRAGENGAYRDSVIKALAKYPRIDSIDEIATYINNVKNEEYKVAGNEFGKAI